MELCIRMYFQKRRFVHNGKTSTLDIECITCSIPRPHPPISLLHISFSVASLAHHGYADLRNSMFDVMPSVFQPVLLSASLNISNDVYSPLVDGNSSLWMYSRGSAVLTSLEVDGCSFLSLPSSIVFL